MNNLYKINFNKVTTVEDIIKILKAMDINFSKDNKDIKDYLLHKDTCNIYNPYNPSDCNCGLEKN